MSGPSVGAGYPGPVHADLQRLLAADLLSDHGSKPLDRLRAIRVELNGAEGDVSFVRRITQGRLDIVGHEVDRRSGAASSPNPSADPSALLFDMPEILSDGGAAGSASRSPRGRSVAVLEPGHIALSLGETLDGIASPSQLSGIEAVAEPDLADLFDSLRAFELELSSIRRQLHDRIDTIQDEIARRYRDGEATVDALLQ